MSKFTHLDETGQLRMVNVGDKAETRRRATAACRIIVGPKVFPLLRPAAFPKAMSGRPPDSPASWPPRTRLN